MSEHRYEMVGSVRAVEAIAQANGKSATVTGSGATVTIGNRTYSATRTAPARLGDLSAPDR